MVRFNNFFYINKYFIYVYELNEEYKFNFIYSKDKYYLYIKNKNKNKKENIKFKIMKDKQEYTYNIYNEKNNFIELQKFENLKFTNTNTNTNEEISINKDIGNIIDNQTSDFNIKYYDNNFFNLYNSNNDTMNNNDIYTFLQYNWHYFGSTNKMQYFKYCIYKNEKSINKIKYTKINYSKNKNNSLIFIDDRFDILFKYILILFLQGIDNSWNLHIYTTLENKDKFQDVLDNLGIEANFCIINKIANIDQYSNLLKSSSFWENINEENLLFFQYDSVCFDKFKEEFFDYNYLGARWPLNITQLPNIYNGNGGTSFRKKSIMHYITSKYNYYLHGENLAEDMYFAKYLNKEGLNKYSDVILDDFSFENVYNEKSVFGHAIFESVSLDKLDDYITKRINNIG